MFIIVITIHQNCHYRYASVTDTSIMNKQSNLIFHNILPVLPSIQTGEAFKPEDKNHPRQ